MQGTKFVQNAAHRPNITPVIVDFVVPNLWTGVIRSSSLGHGELSFHNFWYVQVSQFSNAIDKKYVGRLDVSVNDFVRVQDLEASEEIVGNLPDKVFIKLMIFGHFFFDEALQVAAICILHDDAESGIFLLEEGAFVLDDVGGVDGCQQTNFIEGIIFFFGAELIHFDLFDGVIPLSVFVFFDNFEDSAKTATAQFLYNLKLVHFIL